MLYSADNGFLLAVYNPFHKWHKASTNYCSDADTKGDKILVVWKAKEELKNVIRKKISPIITVLTKFANSVNSSSNDLDKMLEEQVKTFLEKQKYLDYEFFSYIKKHLSFSAKDLLEKDKLNIILQRLDNIHLSAKDVVDDFLKSKHVFQQEMYFISDPNFRNMVYDIINDMYADMLGFHKDDDQFVAENICLAIKKSMSITILTSDSVMNSIINSPGFKEYSQTKHFELQSLLFMS